jgi:membrane dipeptidase
MRPLDAHDNMSNHRGRIMTINRRGFIQAGGALAWSAKLSWALPALGKPKDVPVLMKEAEDLYARSNVIDMLSDEFRDEKGVQFIKSSGVTCISTTLGVRRPADAQHSYMLNAFPKDAAVEDCAAWNKFIKDNSATLTQARSVEDIRRAKQEGKHAVMLNFQNAPLEGRLENLEMFHAMGIRTMQLTYNERNELGDGSTERTDVGLSDFGISVVQRMNELRMMVDSAHSGHQTTLDAVEFCKGPSIFSHSNCAALNEHPRNKTDEQIQKLAAKGGVMGLTTVNSMVKRDLPVTMEDYLDHIDHIRNLVGIDHVALGSDCLVRGWPTDPKGKDEFLSFYGEPYYKPTYRFRYPLGTEGLNDEHKWKYLTAGLIKRGYKEEDIVKVLGGNWLRVFGEVIG